MAAAISRTRASWCGLGPGRNGTLVAVSRRRRGVRPTGPPACGRSRRARGRCA
jgi:hypothetical protein